MTLLTNYTSPDDVDKIRAALYDTTVCLSLQDAETMCETLRKAMSLLVAEAAKKVLEHAFDAQASGGPCDAYSYKFSLADSADRIRRELERLIAAKKETA